MKRTATPYVADAIGARPSSLRTPPPGRRLDVIEETSGDIGSHRVVKLFRTAPCGGLERPAQLGAIAYLSGAKGPKRWIVVLPIWGSSTYPPKKLVTWFTHGQRAAETNVLWVQDPTKRSLMDYAAMKDAATEEEFMGALVRSAGCIDAATEDVRGWMDWILNRQDTDPRGVGIVGCSIGAIVGSLAAGRDGRFAAAAFVMGGGHLDRILASCYGDEAEVRKHTESAFGWSAEDFRREIEQPLAPVDPFSVAGNIDPANVLYIDAGHDSCIPPSAREDLWQAMGRPERITLGYDHKMSFLSMTFLGFDRTTRRIVDFLDERLGVPEKARGGE